MLAKDPATANPRQAINALRSDPECDHHPTVVHALEQTVLHATDTETEDEHAELVLASKLLCDLVDVSQPVEH